MSWPAVQGKNNDTQRHIVARTGFLASGRGIFPADSGPRAVSRDRMARIVAWPATAAHARSSRLRDMGGPPTPQARFARRLADQFGQLFELIPGGLAKPIEHHGFGRGADRTGFFAER